MSTALSRRTPRPAFVAKTEGELRCSVRTALEKYFAHLDGHAPSSLYQMVLGEIEAPLIETVLRHTKQNQTEAAKILGISRGTLRKKLKHYADT